MKLDKFICDLCEKTLEPYVSFNSFNNRLVIADAGFRRPDIPLHITASVHFCRACARDLHIGLQEAFSEGWKEMDTKKGIREVQG